MWGVFVLGFRDIDILGTYRQVIQGGLSVTFFKKIFGLTSITIQCPNDVYDQGVTSRRGARTSYSVLVLIHGQYIPVCHYRVTMVTGQ